MKLAELAFACYIYGPMTDYDNSYNKFREYTKPQIDITNAEHRRALLKWLNDWGCRQFSLKYHEQASEQIEEWYQGIGNQLPTYERSIVDLTAFDFQIITSAYSDLVHRTASKRNRGDGRLSKVDFGPTGTAKILFALRPNSLIPWDVPMRSKFSFNGSSNDYIAYLKLVRKHLEELEETCIKCGFTLSDLPNVLGRHQSSLTKLMDEYHWVTISRNCPPPKIQELSQWMQWW